MWKELVVCNIMPNRYLINDEGEIFDKLTNSYSPKYLMSGYYHVNLQTIDGDIKSFTLHRLTLASFSMCNIIGKNIVNHKDTDKTNNDISNLEYCTASENTRHAIQNICRPLVEEECIPKYQGNTIKAGSNNGRNTVFNDKQIHYICKRMESNIPYPQILEELGLPVQKNYLDILTKIRTKQLWYCISKDYNIPNKEYRSEVKYYTEEQIRQICSLIVKGYNCPKIAKEMGIPFTPYKEADKFRHFIKRLKDKKTFTYITDDYF